MTKHKNCAVLLCFYVNTFILFAFPEMAGRGAIAPLATPKSATDIALPWSSSAVSGNAFCYSGHAHASYKRQGPSSVMLVMNSA